MTLIIIDVKSQKRILAHQPNDSRNGDLVFTMLLFSPSTKPLSTQSPMHYMQFLRQDNTTTSLLLSRAMRQTASPLLVPPPLYFD
jgi:hypothetical protein